MLGGTADLSITAEVTTGTLTYQWYSNATDSNTGGDLIALATESTYSAPTDTEGTMYYYCVVTNTDDTATGDTTTEATSLTAEVTVQTNAEEPNITVQPADVTVDLGGTADLSITAEVTTGTLTYQWYSNATDSNTGGDLIALATESTYSAPTDTEGTMYYYCVVTNTDDTATGDTTTEATSLTAEVTVQTNAEEPNITVQPADVTVDHGGTADLSITAEVTTGTLTYQWYSNATDSNTGGDSYSFGDRKHIFSTNRYRGNNVLLLCRNKYRRHSYGGYNYRSHKFDSRSRSKISRNTIRCLYH